MTSLVRVHFLWDDLVVQAPAGTPLQDIVDASGADVTFGCRAGSCGTCRVRVTRGLENCSPATAEERDFLAGLEASSDHRLACKVTVNGDIDLERP
jgi:ferredoxin